MSETLLKILLGELLTLRIVCKQCKAAAEVPVSALDRQHHQTTPRSGVEIRCPGCGFVIRSGVPQGQSSQTDAFDRLAAALRELGAMSNFEFQFIVPIVQRGDER